jgi:hypothetical protein
MAKKKRKQTVAVIDDSGLLTGFRKLHVAEGWKPAADQVPVPEDCDLAIGRYRWCAPAGAFLPVVPAAPAGAAEPNAMRAMALEIAARAAGKPPPDEAVAWAGWYLKSVDAKGSGA